VLLVFVSPEERPANPLPGILLILAILGAFADWRYRRRGGLGPSGRERVLLVVAISMCAALMVVLGLMGADLEALGAASVQLGVLLFALWQFRRWRIRRANPLPPGAKR